MLSGKLGKGGQTGDFFGVLLGLALLPVGVFFFYQGAVSGDWGGYLIGALPFVIGCCALYEVSKYGFAGEPCESPKTEMKGCNACGLTISHAAKVCPRCAHPN